jgi:hypothetical protein
MNFNSKQIIFSKNITNKPKDYDNHETFQDDLLSLEK